MDILKILCAALPELLYLLHLQEHSSKNILGGKYCSAIISEQTKHLHWMPWLFLFKV